MNSPRPGQPRCQLSLRPAQAYERAGWRSPASTTSFAGRCGPTATIALTANRTPPWRRARGRGTAGGQRSQCLRRDSQSVHSQAVEDTGAAGAASGPGAGKAEMGYSEVLTSGQREFWPAEEITDWLHRSASARVRRGLRSDTDRDSNLNPVWPCPHSTSQRKSLILTRFK
jgi:hypothetical protein